MLCDIRSGVLRLAPHQFPEPRQDIPPGPAGDRQAVVLAGGCFWCTEAVFRELDGVLEVSSGYAGDSAANAHYEAVCNGTTNHAEVIRIVFDPARISYGQLLRLFFSVAHDPTQLNRQGNDRGRQYRSAIFHADEQQREVAQAYIRQLDEAGAFNAPIVTCLEPLTTFYPAESYHQDYARRNPGQPYIAMVAAPKLEKLREYFSDRLKR